MYTEPRESLILRQLNKDYLEALSSREYNLGHKLLKIVEIIKGGPKRIMHTLRWRRFKGSLNHDGMPEQKIPGVLGDVENKKIVVYTCITGNYDTIKEPLYVSKNVDYVIFTDMDVPEDSAWKKIDIQKIPELEGLDNARINRIIKICPHRFLEGYDYSVYVDGSIFVVADVIPVIEMMGDCVIGLHYHDRRTCIFEEAKAIIYAKKVKRADIYKQINEYKNEGYPTNNGLYSNGIIVRKHNDKEVGQLMELWWEEYNKSFGRDQISLPYVIFKAGFKREKIYILGNSIYKNERFRVIEHR